MSPQIREMGQYDCSGGIVLAEGVGVVSLQRHNRLPGQHLQKKMSGRESGNADRMLGSFEAAEAADGPIGSALRRFALGGRHTTRMLEPPACRHSDASSNPSCHGHWGQGVSPPPCPPERSMMNLGTQRMTALWNRRRGLTARSAIPAGW